YGLYCGLAITVLTDRSHPLKICARDNLRYRRVWVLSLTGRLFPMVGMPRSNTVIQSPRFTDRGVLTPLTALFDAFMLSIS
ncbi:MAG: hypothetical protein JAZ02_20085, partial [Candidatus Thiodiazotropha endolucinida]|nr:hypothetical protein [Candidatus Thiodiazotropha endolucinida]